MINLTNQPMMLCESTELDTRIRSAITKLKPMLYEKYGAGYETGRFFLSAPEKYGRNLAEVFDRLVSLDSANGLLGAEFVQTLLTCANSNAQREGFAKTFGELTKFFPGFATLNSSLGVRMKGLLKLLLLALWSEKAILLPFSFTFGGSAMLEQAPIIEQLVNDLFRFFRGYKEGGAVRPAGSSPLSTDAPITLYKYAPRVILATDYDSPADVNLSELGEFLIAMRKLGAGGESVKGTTHAPVLMMAKELLTFYPAEVPFTQGDLESFSIWINSPVYQRTVSLQDFLGNRDTAESLRKAADTGRKINKLGKHAASGKATDAKRKASGLAGASTLEGHAALLDYYKELQGIRRDGINWLAGNSPYPGREHVELGCLSALWAEAFTAYLKYRKVVQNFDTTDNVYRAFNLLCDYLFLYLPWWKELNPGVEIAIPLAPNQLKRGVFVQRTILGTDGLEVGVDALPMTFLDLLAVRQRSTDSRYGTLNSLIQFLEWVEVAFEEDSRIGGKGYRSPLKRLDLPRVKRHTKTNKVPFTKKVYPHLLFYAYALEAFGQYLQQVAAENPDWFSLRVRREQKFLYTGPDQSQPDVATPLSHAAPQDTYPANFGYVPFIRYRGKNYPITRVPNVYQWEERTIEGSRFGVEPGPLKCCMPHLGTLRMLTGAIETGLRLQSLQWLDMRTWDSENTKTGVSQSLEFNLTQHGLGGFVLPLVVSTDKTKDEAWVTQIVFRLRNCFAREQYFRQSIVEPGMEMAVDYEGIANSRFGQIVPLFRSPLAPTPTNDKTYANYWTALLWGFEEYYNAQVTQDGFTQFVYMKKTDFEPVTDYETVDFFDILAIHTPHACRATYATNRTGSLESSDVAMQLGHGSTVVTAHYTVSTPEIMAEKLAYSDRMMLADFGDETIRTDKLGSSLRKGFQADREATIKAFMFAPAVALWSMDDLKESTNGLIALQNSPMNQIVFRETHICPVGEICPSEVIESLGAQKRCGMCPLCMKCVDHLPAIAAKVNQLKMRVRTNIRRAEVLAERGEPEAVVDALYEAAEADANEIVGWQLSHDILFQMLHHRQDAKAYHVEAPEIVQKHLALVTADRNVSEFLLQRIADANAYPSLADPEIQRIADRFHRHLMGCSIQNMDDDPVAVLAGLIKTQLAPRGLVLSDLAAHIANAEKTYTPTLPVMFARHDELLEDNMVIEHDKKN